MAVLLVITNMPSRDSAEKLAGDLVEAGLAACVNILAPCRSVYRWEGKLQREEEHPLLIKTTDDRYPMLEQAIFAGHPYDVPEIIALPVATGFPAYLDWVEAETRAPAANLQRT